MKIQTDEELRRTIIDDKQYTTKEDIKDNLLQIFNDVDVDKIWNYCESKINNILSQNNYEEALRYCCLEHHEIIAGIANSYVHNYAFISLGLLSSDKELATYIRK